jgi:hypothetical protein
MYKSVITFLFLFASTVHAASFDEANTALGRKDYAGAMSMLVPLATGGDASAQYLLGVIYGKGNAVVAEDDVQAAKWYQLAAEQGHKEAQTRTAMMYAYGCGVKQDHTEAVKWFIKSAEQGYAPAQFHLGRMYIAGRGTEKNIKEAVRWWKSSSDLGYARAQHYLRLVSNSEQGVVNAQRAELDIDPYFDAYVNNDFARAFAIVKPLAVRGDAMAQALLGFMYEKGEGAQRDDAEGLKWVQSSAEQGFALAQSDLATRYANGQGVSLNLIEAYKWAHLAIAQHDEASPKLITTLTAKMTAEQVQEAKQLLDQWKTKH